MHSICLSGIFDVAYDSNQTITCRFLLRNATFHLCAAVLTATWGSAHNDINTSVQLP